MYVCCFHFHTQYDIFGYSQFDYYMEFNEENDANNNNVNDDV